jgi:tetratricopeptide (TPR) repeat protein
MDKWRSQFHQVAKAVAVALSLTAVGSIAVAPAAQAAEEKKQTISADVAKKLKPAQDAIQKGDYDTGVTLAQEGLAIATKPYDKETALRMLGFAVGKKQDYAAYAEVLEQLNQLDTVPVEEKNKNYKPLAQIYGQAKNFEKAVPYAQKWAETGGGSEAWGMVSTLYLMQKDYKNGVAALEKSLEGREPTESELKQENFCYYTLGEKAKRMAVMEQLVYRFPKKDYFSDLMIIYQEQNYNERVLLNLYRYGFEKGFLSRESEFVEYGDLAVSIGAPAEALKAIQSGIDQGIVKLVAAGDRNSKLLATAKQGAAEDKRDIAKQDVEVQKRKNGDADVKIGLAYLSLGDATKAIDALERGLSADRIKDVKRVDDAYMTLGIAYLRAGKKDEAAKAFTSAKSAPQMAKPAALWLLLTT